MTFFSHTTAAERYARSRPYFHPLVVEKIKQRLALRESVADALDVACGTGQSTRALRAISKRTVGTDVSREMLAFAHADLADASTMFITAPSEVLPVRDTSFDLVTVALAFHWFDRARFLREARRVLRRDGWLVIYNNGFGGRMRENAAFEAWNRERYIARYPTPPRNDAPFTDAAAAQFGFRFSLREQYANDVTFTADGLANYLMTQSNVIARVEQGEEPAGDVLAWLMQALTPMFPNERCTFEFGGHVWYLQREE